MVVLIGPDWCSVTDERGARRLNDKNDFVRIEVGAALRRRVKVFPVLIDGALPPRASELPKDLRPLARKQALILDYAKFDADVVRLARAIASALQPGVSRLPRAISPAPVEGPTQPMTAAACILANILTAAGKDSEKMGELPKLREQDHKEFKGLVEPTFVAMKDVHRDYLLMFDSLRQEIETGIEIATVIAHFETKRLSFEAQRRSIETQAWVLWKRRYVLGDEAQLFWHAIVQYFSQRPGGGRFYFGTNLAQVLRTDNEPTSDTTVDRHRTRDRGGGRPKQSDAADRQLGSASARLSLSLKDVAEHIKKMSASDASQFKRRYGHQILSALDVALEQLRNDWQAVSTAYAQMLAKSAK